MYILQRSETPEHCLQEPDCFVLYALHALSALGTFLAFGK